MPTLKLLLFGPPRLERDGAPVEIKRRKVMALLVYLAVTAQPHSRDALATLFYPDHSQSRARTYLRRDLSILNGILSGERLAADRDVAELRLDDYFELDIAQFRQHIAASPKKP